MSDDEVNLEDWISGARLPERSVTVYGRADLVAEFQNLETQLVSGRTATSDDDRLVSTEHVLASQMADLREQLQGSAMTFRFRALSRDEAKAITDPVGEGEDISADWLAKAAVAPKMTAEQARAIRSRIGEGQYASLWDAAWGVSNDKKVDVPFSLAASLALKAKAS